MCIRDRVWHWAGYPDRERVSFWVIFRRLTAKEDLEIAPLPEPVSIADPLPNPPHKGEGMVRA